MGTLGSAAEGRRSGRRLERECREDTAKKLGIEYTAVFVKTLDHAAYYTNPEELWDRRSAKNALEEFLGAQAAGRRGQCFDRRFCGGNYKQK